MALFHMKIRVFLKHFLNNCRYRTFKTSLGETIVAVKEDVKLHTPQSIGHESKSKVES